MPYGTYFILHLPAFIKKGVAAVADRDALLAGRPFSP
jgi:hypothetical protein